MHAVTLREEIALRLPHSKPGVTLEELARQIGHSAYRGPAFSPEDVLVELRALEKVGDCHSWVVGRDRVEHFALTRQGNGELERGA